MIKAIRVFLSPLLLSYSAYVYSENSHIIVSLEALPPLVQQSGEGLIVDMLSEIENISNYRFDTAIMNYARAKRQLKSGHSQLIGLTPKNSETDEFYDFAIELDWGVQLSVDLFTTSPNKAKNLNNIYIGVPTGNADFFSELLNIPRKNFVEVTSLPQLAQMLNKNRIDALLFERIAMAETFLETGYEEVYYQQVSITPASLAVAKTPEGEILKTELDNYIKVINTEIVFQNYNDYLLLPKSGSIDAITNLLRLQAKARQ